MLPYEMIAGGRFSITTALIASGLEVSCKSQNPPDYVLLKNLTAWGKKNVAGVLQWEWEQSLGNGYAIGVLQSAENSTPQLPAMSAYVLPATGSTAVDAISCYNTVNPPTYTALATTAITGIAGTFVVTMANTGSISVGDWVRIYADTGELQIAGYAFQVTAVTANVSITLGYMASSGITFAADATAGSVQKFIPGRMYPKVARIANVTQAAQCKVYFTGQNTYSPGEKVSFRVSSAFGMKELNNVSARVLTVTNSATESSIVLDLNSSSFTAFAFPSSTTAAAGVSPAICVPSSSAVVPLNGSATTPQEPPGTNLVDSFDNRNNQLIRFGSALFNVSGHLSLNGDVWMWQAFKYSDYKVGNVTFP